MSVTPVAARRATFLPFAPPPIGDEEIAEVVDTLRSGWISTGPKTKRFETEFAAFVQAAGAVASSSCTASLHTALAVLGVGPGDEVITTPVTFASSANVVEHLGARPVLADVQSDTLNIDPDRIAAAITPRTRVLLPVHFAGHPVDLDPIRELAAAHGLAVLEDAAHAVAARYRGRPIGSSANLAAFSFYATKNLTTAEGGMLTGDVELLAQARRFGLHGISRDATQRYHQGGSWYYEVVLPGFKYNMTDIQAALGLCQLRKLDRFQARRHEIAARYNEAFADEPALETPSTRADVDHAWHLYPLRLRLEALRIGRDQFIHELTARNIGTSVHFIPVHLHPYYRDRYGYAPEAFPVAYQAYLRLLSLPLHPGLDGRDTDDVIDAVLDVVRKHRR